MMETTRYVGEGLIEWRMTVDAAEFYVSLMTDYLRTHDDKGVSDDRNALLEAIKEATFIEDDD